MIREVIKIVEETKVLGHNVQISKEEVLKFLNKKYGNIDDLASFSVIGNMIKILFVAGGHTSSYTTSIEKVLNFIGED